MAATDTEGSTLDRQALVEYLDSYLDAQQGRDFCPNGLQVEGSATIRRLVTGVSACRDLFVQARRRQADAVLVHHGIFWQGQPTTLTGVQRQRVAELLAADLNLIAYHLPLDRHPEVGNNAVAARSLGLEDLQPFGEFEGLPLGFRGRLSTPVALEEFLSECQRVFVREPQVFPYGPDRVTSVGIISGAAERCFYDAIAAGLDLFLTGEVSEWVMNLAREASTHFVAAGHYATERLGVEALGEHLRQNFGLAVEFIDIPNPV